MAPRIFGSVRSYLGGVLIAADQFANAVFYGFPDETASSRLGRRLKRLRGKDPLSQAGCAVLDALDPDHCATSIEETPDGKTDPHHLGRVIRELPRDPLHKIRGAGLAVVIALVAVGCATLGNLRDCRYITCEADKSCAPDGDGKPWKCIVPPPPTPEPSPTAGPVPSPSPIVTTPTPVPSPVPSPVVTPPPPSPDPHATPSPKPPSGPECKLPPPRDRECSTCGEIVAYDLERGNLDKDAQGRLYNDVNGDPNQREYVDPKTCWVTRAGDGVVFKRRYEQVLCTDADKTVCPPSPLPTPPTVPPPPDGDDACALGPDGNYPVPPVGTCPACWRRDPNLIAYWGIALRSKTDCSGPTCPYGKKINVDITPHSAKPYLRHRQQGGGGGTDTWEGCQPCADPGNPDCRAAIPEIWVYPKGAQPGLCDPFSGSLYWCHHKPQLGQDGPTKFEVRQPPFRSIVVQVP